MTFRGAYFTVVVLTHVGCAALFLFLHLYRRSKFLVFFALAWLIEALRVSLPVARTRGVEFSDRWFALQDVGYFVVTWLLLSAVACWVGRRGLPRIVPVLYFGLSLPASLVNHVFFRPFFLHPGATPSPAELFLPILANNLVLFVPGGVARLIATAWIFGHWKRTRLPGALVLAIFFLLHALGSLSVPLRWYFSYDPPDLYLTWFIEVIGVSVGVVMVAMHEQQAALAAAEQRYQLFFDHMADAALLFDRDELCSAANPIARGRLGLADGQAFQLRELFAEHTAYEAFLRAAADAASPKLETILKTPGGRVFPASISGAIHRDGPSEPRGFFLTFEDITLRKEAESERAILLGREQAARAEAERANRLKDDFLSTLSHELRTPLTAVLGWARIVRQGALDAQARQRAVEAIERNARAQTQLIDEILDLSRIASGKLRLDMHRVDLRPVIEAAIATVQPAADAKGIPIRARFEPRAVEPWADPDRLQQVVLNLLSNAVKFTPAGGRVDVELRRVDAHATITVSDTGEGIDAGFLPHVFDRFRQADGSVARRHGGLGLGLAIVRELVELHGGSARAESRGHGLGATFTVSLPLTRAELPAPAAPAPAETAPRIRLDGMRILVAEDNPDTQELLTVVLESYGARVLVTASAREAIEALATKPDVLVSDIGLGGDDGYKLIRDIRALPTEDANIPAVALTAHARLADREKALASGFQVHVAKPVDPADLAQAILTVAHTEARGSDSGRAPSEGTATSISGSQGAATE